MLKFNFKIFPIFMNNTLHNFVLNFIFIKCYDFKKEKYIFIMNHFIRHILK